MARAKKSGCAAGIARRWTTSKEIALAFLDVSRATAFEMKAAIISMRKKITE